ncbi:MoaD/ThiS family protein [Alteromonas facilis]|uniref:MoaD/ThiS family protein n=1 Tax=Alteromonas facilis TaxID=2048004 RepID=UPI000C292CD5|nr:MoaD family protein [Alteromonas facilis]
MIDIQVRFFALFRERLGIDSMQFTCATGSRVEDVLNGLYQQNPAIAEHVQVGQLLCAVNHKLVGMEHSLQSGDELALLPPVTGG